MKFFVIILSVFIITSCGGRYSTQYFYSTPFSELDNSKSQFHHKFYRGKKIPTFVVGGNKYYGKNIQIKVYNEDSDKLVRESDKTILPTGQQYTFWFRDGLFSKLPSGKYQIHLVVNDSIDSIRKIVVER
jgi:hypothetical protein